MTFSKVKGMLERIREELEFAKVEPGLTFTPLQVGFVVEQLDAAKEKIERYEKALDKILALVPPGGCAAKEDKSKCPKCIAKDALRGGGNK